MTPVPENFAVKIEGIVLRQYYDTRHPYIASTSFMTATPIFERNLRKGVRRVNRVYMSAYGPIATGSRQSRHFSFGPQAAIVPGAPGHELPGR